MSHDLGTPKTKNLLGFTVRVSGSASFGSPVAAEEHSKVCLPLSEIRCSVRNVVLFEIRIRIEPQNMLHRGLNNYLHYFGDGGLANYLHHFGDGGLNNYLHHFGGVLIINIVEWAKRTPEGWWLSRGRPGLQSGLGFRV